MLHHQQPEEGEGAEPSRGPLGRGERRWGWEMARGRGLEQTPPLPQVKVQLHCGGDRREELEIFTARACQCDMCRLSRY